MNTTDNIAENVILSYCKTYLNPRTKNYQYHFGNFSLMKDNGFYYNESISYDLYFNFNNKLLNVSQISEKYLKNLNIDDDIFEIIKTMFVIPYLTYEGFGIRENFIHQKFISFFNLIFYWKKLSNKAKNIHIRSLFYNSHLSDNIKFIKLVGNDLHFKEHKVKSLLCHLINDNQSDEYLEIINYCLSMVDVFEKGFEKEIDVGMFDDCFFDDGNRIFDTDSKPYFYKNIIGFIGEIYSQPKTNFGDIFNKIYLLNFMILNKKYRYYIEKYQQNNKTLIDILADMQYLENLYIYNKRIL